jgi:hypothetical protein
MNSIIIQYVHGLSYKEEKQNVFLIFQKKSLLIKSSACFQAPKAVFIFPLAVTVLFLFSFISQIWKNHQNLSKRIVSSNVLRQFSIYKMSDYTLKRCKC